MDTRSGGPGDAPQNRRAGPARRSLTASCEFGPDQGAVRAARQFASEATKGWDVSQFDGQVVVSELAANAVLHGRSPFRVSLRNSRRRVSIEVEDRSDDLPTLSDPHGANGRGLLLVDRIARAWGARRTGLGGKVVWAELEREPRPGNAG
jgi:hypothetical protein